jgi:spore coat protein CotH
MRLIMRRNYALFFLLVLVSAFFSLALGNKRIIAYTVPGSQQYNQPGLDFSSNIEMLDDSVVHSIEILIDEDDYQQMITTYQETGIKEYFHADVVIDGTSVTNVGLRLKGNASLRTSVGGRGGMGMGGFGGMRGQLPLDPENMPQMGRNRPDRAAPDAENLPEFPFEQVPDPENLSQDPMGQLPDQQNLPLPDFAQGSSNLADGKILIPLMIKFDEFVTGQTYQGYSLLAVRTYGTSYNEAKLQEPLTNTIFLEMGLPAAETAFAGVRLNGAEEQLYVISEVIDDTYIEKHFDHPDGILYKAELGSTLSYQGEDPSNYTSSFTQQTRKNDADMAPLIDFIRFLDEADDATFENELPIRLDVDAFATYLAINNLLVNTDSIAGMNNNYYLYYDDQAARFTLLMWDANESFGRLNFSGGGQSAATHGLYDTGGGRGAGPGGMSGSNTLVTRFMDNATFKALYEQKLKEVYQEAFVSGAITAKVEEYANMIRYANLQRPLVDLQAYDQAVDSLLDFVEQRYLYLAGTALLGQP